MPWTAVTGDFNFHEVWVFLILFTLSPFWKFHKETILCCSPGGIGKRPQGRTGVHRKTKRVKKERRQGMEIDIRERLESRRNSMKRSWIIFCLYAKNILFHLPRRFMQSLVWTQQWIAPLDAKCKIKTGSFWEHKTGKLIVPNKILIFTDFWHYVRAVLNSTWFLPLPCPN